MWPWLCHKVVVSCRAKPGSWEGASSFHCRNDFCGKQRQSLPSLPPSGPPAGLLWGPGNLVLTESEVEGCQQRPHFSAVLRWTLQRLNHVAAPSRLPVVSRALLCALGIDLRPWLLPQTGRTHGPVGSACVCPQTLLQPPGGVGVCLGRSWGFSSGWSGAPGVGCSEQGEALLPAPHAFPGAAW